MKASQRKAIVLNLITNDLVNCKLIYGLRALRIDAGDYSLSMAKSILQLMGFNKAQRTLELYDLYTHLCRKAVNTAYSDADQKAMRGLAKEIYEALVSFKGSA